MASIWFVLVAFMFGAYVLLDGFDLGIGAAYPFLARDEPERKALLSTIGPLWDGNEVWLIGAGASLFLAFPVLYAVSFSGFFLPLMIVLWLLMGRGIALEFRRHVDHPVWKTFWDYVFSVSSALLALLLGMALGNVVRGVPIDSSGQFFEPLWTGFGLAPPTGFVDWYTLLAGLVSLAALTLHGSLWAALNTTGDLALRARRLAERAWNPTALLLVAATIATLSVQPLVTSRFSARPAGLFLPALALAGLALTRRQTGRGKDGKAFLSSCLFLAALLASTAFGLYPCVLPSLTDPARSLTVFNSAAADGGLRTALVWWIPGMLLVCGYFAFLYRSFSSRGEPNEGNPARSAER